MILNEFEAASGLRLAALAARGSDGVRHNEL